MMSKLENQGTLSRLGAFAIIFYSILFGIEIVMPWVLHMANYPPATVGDANTKAILTNIVILIVGYLFGRNEGSKQNEQVIQKLVDTNKKAQDALVETVAKPADVVVPAGDSVTVKAEPEKNP